MKRLSAFVIPFALSACAVTPSQQSGTQPVEIRFAAQINGQAFECGKSYSGVGTTKSTITPREPPRVLRGLLPLRRWSHEQTNEVSPGAARASHSYGLRAA